MSENSEKAVVYSAKKGFLKKRIKNSNLSDADVKKRKFIGMIILCLSIIVALAVTGLFLNNKKKQVKDGVYQVTTGTSTFNEEDTQKLIEEQKQKGIVPKDVNISGEDDGNVQ